MGLSKQEVQSCYQNDFKKSRGGAGGGGGGGGGSGSSSGGGGGTARNRIAQVHQVRAAIIIIIDVYTCMYNIICRVFSKGGGGGGKGGESSPFVV